MADLNFPSMFDTRYAMDRQMQEDAHKAAVAGGGSKRYGMYYNSSLLGDRDNAFKRSIGGMFGIGGDPRIQQQQALDEIMARFPNPQTPEDFIEISNALQGVGLHSYAEAARDMANETRASMPTPTKPAADIEKYNEAVAGGYEGTFYQFLMDLKKAGADTTTMLPTPAKGFQYEQDENGNWIATIIPGGSADLEQIALGEKEIQKKLYEQRSANVVLKNIGYVRDAIDNPTKVFGLDIYPVGFGSWLAKVPGTQAKGVQGMINTIRGNVGFDKLQAMRNASPTGGALGQVSELELNLLMSTIGSLDQAQSKGDILRVLNEIEYMYNIIVHGQPPSTDVPDDPAGVG